VSEHDQVAFGPEVRGATAASHRHSGGRTWWAQLAFTRINIALTILQKEFEELMNVKGIGEKSFLKLKPMVTVSTDKAEKTGDR
jgi:hypothetical protein